jgi:hypothetical protein
MEETAADVAPDDPDSFALLGNETARVGSPASGATCRSVGTHTQKKGQASG